MKKFTGILAVFVVFAMVSGAFAQSGSGGTGGASSSGSGSTGAPAGAASGTSSDSSSGGSSATTGSPATGTDKSRAEEPKSSSPSASPSTTSNPSTMASGDFTGRHTMEGEVVSIDQKKGHLKLKTAEGNMDLHFPPSALSNVKKGDRIAVELAMKPAGSASLKSNDAKGAASPKMEKEKK